MWENGERKLMTPNQWADFWRNQAGVNIIPATNNHADSDKCKKPFWTDKKGVESWITWKKSGYQTNPITQEQHDEWKKNNAFKDGMAIICGEVFHNEQFEGMWLNGIDCDNRAGVDVLCPQGIEYTSKGTLVEQHGNPDKCHILFYSDEPLKNRALNNNSKIQIEVKSMGKNLLYCAGGYHKDGSLIDIVGTKKIKFADKNKLEKKLDQILGTKIENKTNTKSELSNLNEGDNRQGEILSSLGTYFARIPQNEIREIDCINKSVSLNSELGTPYDESRAVKIGKDFFKYRMGDDADKPKDIENKAMELLEKYDTKEALEKLKEYCIENGDKKGDSILKPILKNCANKMKNKFSEDEVSETIQAYNIGSSLIQKTIKSLNDTEQVVVQVMIKDKPHWIDILSPTFNQMVRIGVQDKHDEIFNNTKYETAITNLHAHSLFNGTETQQIFNRCALVNGILYYDLQDADGVIYKISKDEIRECQNDEKIPIFLKSSSASPQPKPLFDDDKALDKIVKLYRINDDDKVVFKSHLICYFLTGFPIPIAIIHGEQGSAKTSTSSGMKSLHDPEGENALSLPEKVDDLAVNLSRHGTSNFDNTDNFSKDTSQFLCKAVTGTQYVKRAHYTNGEEFALTLKSKIILNGISPSIDQPDLLERSIFYELPTINKKDRMTDKKSLEKLNELKSHVLGVVFKTIQKAMQIYDDVDKELDGSSLPRMASFAVWGEAISRSLGHENNSFIERYDAKLESSNLGLTDEYPIIEPLMNYVKDIQGQEVTMTKIFSIVGSEDSKDERIPKDNKGLGKQLKQLAPTIRALGYEVVTRTNNVRPKKESDLARGVKLVKFTKIDENGVDSFGN
jgi:hypothetical protein